MTDSAPACASTLGREIVCAYLASGSRVLSWVVVTAIVYRRGGADCFAMLALVRTTLGLLNYTTLGLAPAMVRMLAKEKRAPGEASEVYSSANQLVGIAGLIGAALTLLYVLYFPVIHDIPQWMAAEFNNVILMQFVAFFGLGMVSRIVGDVFGAVLQVRGWIATDNLLLAGAEWAWIILVTATSANTHGASIGADELGLLRYVAVTWAASSALLFAVRGVLSFVAMGPGALSVNAMRIRTSYKLLSFGLFVALAQAADFLYAPTDNILINRFINPVTVAVYAPAIQIDAGLLLLVSGLAAVLLPRSALAHAAGDRGLVRRYYVRGTLLSLALLTPAAIVVWMGSARIMHLWLGNPMPATLVILPMVLLHTVIGGSSAVGRSVLLAMGKVKPFTAAVLIAGGSNVILSFIFVRYCGWGLPGIVLGTILAVVGRCAVWTPWYTLRVLRLPVLRGEQSVSSV